MTYLVIFNGTHYAMEKVHANSWLDFIRELNRLVEYFKQPPDIIYLIDSRISSPYFPPNREIRDGDVPKKD